MGETTEPYDRVVECNDHKYLVISTVKLDGTSTFNEQCSVCGKKRIRIRAINKINIKQENNLGFDINE